MVLKTNSLLEGKIAPCRSKTDAWPENRDVDQRHDAGSTDPDVASPQIGFFCGVFGSGQKLREPEEARGPAERCCGSRDGDQDGTHRVEQSGDAGEKTACEIRRHREPLASPPRELVAADQGTQPPCRPASEEKVQPAPEYRHRRSPDKGRYATARHA